MDKQQRREALSAFLKNRRARLVPSELGLATYGRRRTPGLRREEVAELASVSTAWYTYLEQGRDVHVSRGVLENIANALHLNQAERLHISWLADQPLLPEPLPAEENLRPVYQAVIDSLGSSPAYISGRGTRLVGWNRAASLVFGDFSSIPEEDRNLLWLLFTDTKIRRRIVEKEQFALEALTSFRATGSQYLSEPAVKKLVERLHKKSAAFREAWEQQDLTRTCAVAREIEHPELGLLTFEVASLQISGDPDLKCCVYNAPAGSETKHKMQILLQNSQTPSL